MSELELSKKDAEIFFKETLKIDCKYVKKEGESCTLNNNCTYPNCDLHDKQRK